MHRFEDGIHIVSAPMPYMNDDFVPGRKLVASYTPPNKFSNNSAIWTTRSKHYLEWSYHRKYCMYTLQIWHTEHSIYAKFATNESVKYIGSQFVILPLIQCHNFCKILLLIFKFCTRISLKCTCNSKTRIIGSIHTYMYIYTVYTQIYLYKILKFYLFRRYRPPSLLAVLLITFYGNRSSILC